MKLNSRKSKVMVVGKKETGVSWKIGEGIMEEIEESKCGVWVDRKLQGDVSYRRWQKKEDEWIGRVTWMSRVNGQVEVLIDRERMVWRLLARPNMEYAVEVW